MRAKKFEAKVLSCLVSLQKRSIKGKYTFLRPELKNRGDDFDEVLHLIKMFKKIQVCFPNLKLYVSPSMLFTASYKNMFNVYAYQCRKKTW